MKKYVVEDRGDGHYSIRQVEIGEGAVIAAADSWDEALVAVRQAEKRRSRNNGERRGCLAALFDLFRR